MVGANDRKCVLTTECPAQDNHDGENGSRPHLLSACSPLEDPISEASNSEAYSMFALSLDNDSCRSPEVAGATPPSMECPRKKLYLPEQKPLTHFQVYFSVTIQYLEDRLASSIRPSLVPALRF